MAVTKLSQSDALMIEMLRAGGVSDEEILAAVKNQDVGSFQEIGNGDFDFTKLVDFAREHWDEFEKAVTGGYQIKFNTINGIKYLLKVKCKQVVDIDYVNGGDHLDQIKLTKTDLAWLRSVLSPYWAVTEQDELPDGGRVVRLSLQPAK